MKKLNLLLVSMLFLSGCTTVQDENSQHDTSSVIDHASSEQVKENPISHVDMAYEIEELEVPQELQCENYEFRAALQDNHATENSIHFQILTLEDSLYSTVGLYDYDFKTQKAELIKDYQNQGTRVWDSIYDDQGNLYEFVLFYEGDKEYGEVRYNGEPLIRTEPQLPFNIRRFEKLGDDIYLLTENIIDEAITKWLVLHFKDGTVEIVDEVIQDREGIKNELPNVVTPNVQLNSSHWISYAMEDAGKYYIHSFNQNDSFEFEVPQLPINIINLKDYILVNTLVNENEPENRQCKIFSYEIKTKELKEISNEEIGPTTQVSDNEFYSVDIDETIKLHTFDGKELRVKEIEQIPKNASAQTIVRIDEHTDFVKIMQGSDTNSFYLIHWKE